MDGTNGLEAAEGWLARGSRSTTAAGVPASSKDAARMTARVVLPVPPFRAMSASVNMACAPLPRLSPDSAIWLAARERPTPPRCHDQGR